MGIDFNVAKSSISEGLRTINTPNGALFYKGPGLCSAARRNLSTRRSPSSNASSNAVASDHSFALNVE